MCGLRCMITFTLAKYGSIGFQITGSKRATIVSKAAFAVACSRLRKKCCLSFPRAAFFDSQVINVQPLGLLFYINLFTFIYVAHKTIRSMRSNQLLLLRAKSRGRVICAFLYDLPMCSWTWRTCLAGNGSTETGETFEYGLLVQEFKHVSRHILCFNFITIYWTRCAAAPFDEFLHHTFPIRIRLSRIH